MNSDADGASNANARRASAPTPEGCFAAGTLVHTVNGLVPIEKIRVGDRVLSLDDATGERTHRRVVRSVARDRREVFMFGYVVSGDAEARYLVVTGKQPVWLDGRGWVLVDNMAGAPSLTFLDGSEGFVCMISKLLATERPGIGFACHHGWDEGPTVDFSDGGLVIDPQYTIETSAFGDLGFVEMTVCHLEIEDFGSYFVGEAGVRVHGGGSDGS